MALAPLADRGATVYCLSRRYRESSLACRMNLIHIEKRGGGGGDCVAGGIRRLEHTDRHRMERALHCEPKDCSELTYLRQHTGFCRQITVTEGDLERLAAR